MESWSSVPDTGRSRVLICAVMEGGQVQLLYIKLEELYGVQMNEKGMDKRGVGWGVGDGGGTGCGMVGNISCMIQCSGVCVFVVHNNHYYIYIVLLQCSLSVSELTRQASSPVLYDLFCILVYDNYILEVVLSTYTQIPNSMLNDTSGQLEILQRWGSSNVNALKTIMQCIKINNCNNN